MQINVTSRHMNLSSELRNHAEKRADSLVKYYDRISSIDVVLESGGGHTSVEIIVYAEHKNTFVARKVGDDAHTLIDVVRDKLERQLKKYKGKQRNRKHTV